MSACLGRLDFTEIARSLFVMYDHSDVATFKDFKIRLKVNI